MTSPPLVSHLIELRRRLLYSALAIAVIFIGLFPFANEIYHFFASPLQAFLPEGSAMIATGVAAPFLIPLKLTLFIAFVASAPLIFYQLWHFLAPGLYRKERRLLAPLMISSVLLFYLGMAFAYTIVFPLVFHFFTHAPPQDVRIMTDISHYFDFIFTLLCAFGLSFEVPVATVLLVSVGALQVQTLVRSRPYIIIACFVLGMFLTPPDVISQTLLAVPMWLLYECGIVWARVLARGGR